MKSGVRDSERVPSFISIIIPVYNEEESLPHLFNVLQKNIEKFSFKTEVIFINDGSTDRTPELLDKAVKKHKNFKVIHFRRNFGQTAAFMAGFDHASGEIIVTLDADLQNDPADIPSLIEKLSEGYDIVSGWRKNRKDDFWLRILPSKIANKIISYFTKVNLHDYGCSLKAYRKDVIDHLYLYGELHRFIPALASMIGAKVTEIPVRHHPRKFGKSKYGISRTFRVILDLLTVKFLLKFVDRPMHFFGTVGLFALLAGFFFLGILIYYKIFYHQDMTDSPFLLLSTITSFSGLTFILFGIIAEIIVRIYFESTNKSVYYIKRIVGFSSDEKK